MVALGDHGGNELLGGGKHLRLDCRGTVRGHSHVMLAVRPFNADDRADDLDLALAGRLRTAWFGSA